MDGFVNVHDLVENNGGMFASQKVLRDAYTSVELPNDNVFNESIHVSKVLSLADFAAWAGHASLIRAAQAVAGNARTIDTAPKPRSCRRRPAYLHHLWLQASHHHASSAPANGVRAYSAGRLC